MRKEKRTHYVPLAYRAEEAFRKAVAEAQAEHRRHGVPIAIWRDGQIVRVPPDEIEVRKSIVEYKPSKKKKEK